MLRQVMLMRKLLRLQMQTRYSVAADAIDAAVAVVVADAAAVGDEWNIVQQAEDYCSYYFQHSHHHYYHHHYHYHCSHRYRQQQRQRTTLR